MSTPVHTVSHVVVEIKPDIADAGQANTLLFSAATPPSWSVEATKHIFHGNQGQPETIISSVQTPKYGTMTLTQGWDENHVLAKWKAIVEDPSKTIDDKKRQVIVTFYKNNGTDELFAWSAEKALLTGYSTSPSDPASNGVLTVTATIDADKWEQTIQGTPIAAQP
jgi:T4-like virus tail tube protein gp19